MKHIGDSYRKFKSCLDEIQGMFRFSAHKKNHVRSNLAFPANFLLIDSYCSPLFYKKIVCDKTVDRNNCLMF